MTFKNLETNEELSEQKVEEMLMPALNDLAAKIELFEKSVYGNITEPTNSVSRIFKFCIQFIAQEFESFLLSKSSKRVMQGEYLNRIHQGMRSFLEILQEYGFSESSISQVSAVFRLYSLLSLLQSDTRSLAETYLSLPESMKDPPENVRKSTAPYISKVMLSKVLKYRSLHMNDQIATNFLKRHHLSENFISRIFH